MGLKQTDTKVVSSGGIGMGGIIFVVLLVLKITGNIAMGWFWVITSFIWAPLLVVMSLFILIFAIGFVVGIFRVLFELISGKK